MSDSVQPNTTQPDTNGQPTLRNVLEQFRPFGNSQETNRKLNNVIREKQRIETSLKELGEQEKEYQKTFHEIERQEELADTQRRDDVIKERLDNFFTADETNNVSNLSDIWSDYNNKISHLNAEQKQTLAQLNHSKNQAEALARRMAELGPEQERLTNQLHHQQRQETHLTAMREMDRRNTREWNRAQDRAAHIQACSSLHMLSAAFVLTAFVGIAVVATRRGQ